ncbi:ABC transporter permease [Algibacter mikhailovii]|uniref:Transport permease protein n=1 Tax=Algibacter mikhailovii TaxID=425498 RepID=A0A918VAD7_9FLAO|nr:ABC transporter permease [Algibacter mikhailovii]GGZ81095.1 transport permease protein [Algibacter mikhailovii]
MNDKWLYTISSKKKLIDFNFKEIWQYRDLLLLFVKRDVITVYKQTVLGPLWYVIQPLFTSVIFTLVFNTIANIDTGGIPPFLFNLAGVVSWNYFKECLTGTADIFKKNQAIFGKVYFPRVIMPLSIVLSNLIKFGIQLTIFVVFYLYFITQGSTVRPNMFVLFFPVIVLVMGLLGLGLGMIISSMVTRYRDLSFLLTFGVQLLMYISLVTLPYSLFADNSFAWAVDYNPMAYVIEFSRYVLLGEGTTSLFGVVYTLVFAVSVFLLGILIFNKTEKSFIDTI